MVRPLHPWDLLGLIPLHGRVNQARPWDGLGKEEGILSAWPLFFRETFHPRGRRCTLVWSHGGRIRGVASARCRRGPRAWEVDRLFLSPGREDTLPELLERLSAEAVAGKVEKVFLRLPAESIFLDMARTAGFCPYREETLYRFSGAPRPISPELLRPRAMEDEQPLFQLYGVATPAAIRFAEGITLEEWQQAWEPCNGQELVFPGEVGLQGWLSLRRRGRLGQFQLLVHPNQGEKVGALVDHCLGALRDQPSVFCLAPAFDSPLRQALEGRGGEKIAEYISLVKPLAARISEPKLIPQQA